MLDLNLGLETDLWLHAETGSVERRDDCIVVLTPDTPEYFFGNMLVLPQRPSDLDLPDLESQFTNLVGADPRIAHRTFTWPESGDSAASLDTATSRGYELTICDVLVAHPHDIVPAPKHPRVTIRALESQADWDVWSALQLADMPNPLDTTSQRFIAHQQRAYRSLIDRGLGHWWGAFIDGEHAGSLGVFFFGGIGRFQSVITAPAFRNQGVCKTLVTEVLRLTRDRANAWVIVADESYHAGKIYRSLGFKPQGRTGSLCHASANAVSAVSPESA